MKIDIGVMIGSSADGVDIVAAVISERSIELKFHHHRSFSNGLQRQLKDLADKLEEINVERINQVQDSLTIAVIEALKEVLLEHPNVTINQISYHGYTLCHLPQHGLSWQLGDVEKIASSLDCLVVHDFRQNIVEHGGKGAPLIPNFHHWIAQLQGRQAINYINLGGISNISVINKEFSWGTDIGPGNCLSDALVGHYFNRPFDSEGQLSAKGVYDEVLIEAFEDFYAHLLPSVRALSPKEAFCLTRQDFKIERLIPFLTQTKREPCDILLASHHFVASRIAAVVEITQVRDLIFFGGGSLNTTLMQIMRDKLENYCFLTTFWHPQVMEGLAFAWLGYSRLSQKKHCHKLIGSTCDLLLGHIAQPGTRKFEGSASKIERLKEIFV